MSSIELKNSSAVNANDFISIYFNSASIPTGFVLDWEIDIEEDYS